MSVATEAIARPRAKPAERLTRLIARTPVHLALLAIAVVWLVPTVGLAITSIRPRDEIQATGWWTSFNELNFTLHNYDLVLENARMGSSFVNSIIITIPSTLLPLFIGAAAAYAFSTCARPASASSMARCVAFGSWRPVRSPSMTRNPRSGVITRSAG